MPVPEDDPFPPERLSIAEAASRLGISADTLRRRIKRGQLKAKRDNTGKLWLDLPVDHALAATPVPRRTSAYATVQEEQTGVVEELRSHIGSLRSELDRAYAERDRLLTMLAEAQGALVQQAKGRGGRFWQWLTGKPA